MDGDIECDPGKNDTDFSIKEQDTLRVEGRPKNLALKED